MEGVFATAVMIVQRGDGINNKLFIREINYARSETMICSSSRQVLWVTVYCQIKQDQEEPLYFPSITAMNITLKHHLCTALDYQTAVFVASIVVIEKRLQ